MTGTEYLLDTNIIIGLLKGHQAAIAVAEQADLTLDRATVSQITRMELLGYPKLTIEEDQAIRSFLAACRVSLLDERIEAEAIHLRRSGLFKLPDAIVAATAITGRIKLLVVILSVGQEFLNPL